MTIANDMRNTRNDATQRAGFTLIELLLVLLILSILAAIVYPSVTHRGGDARIAAAKTQIAAFRTALATFEADNGRFPAGQNALRQLVERIGAAPDWHGPYLEELPKDPWGNAYIYESPGKRHPASYDLTSMGPDGRLGTEDDITNSTERK